MKALRLTLIFAFPLGGLALTGWALVTAANGGPGWLGGAGVALLLWSIIAFVVAVSATE